MSGIRVKGPDCIQKGFVLYQAELCYTLNFLGVPPRRGGLLARPYEGSGCSGVRGAPSRLALRGETAPPGRPPHPSRRSGGQRLWRWPPP